MPHWVSRPATVVSWLDDVTQHVTPSGTRLLSGTPQEEEELRAILLENGSLMALDARANPGSFLYRSDVNDVARTEQCTFICTAGSKEDVGPTNNWMSTTRAYQDVWHRLFKNSMADRVMYVVPYCLGPEASPHAKFGIELTDSAYVALSLMTMYRVAESVTERIMGYGASFVRGVHAKGTLDPKERFICHLPEVAQGTIWSINSEYGGNGLLPKKCHALRIASWQAQREGWMAEHMAVLGLQQPGSARRYWFGAAMPSGCGKTNLGLLTPSLPGYMVETLSEDLVHLHPNVTGGLSGINPEYGFFGILKDTSTATNPVAMRMLERNVTFTNAALTPHGTPWWEGKTAKPPEGLLAWDGTPWSPEQKRPAAHPNSRFTVSARHCSTLSKAFDSPDGVHMDAIILGGRRAKGAPLVYETLGWEHGTYVGATMVSETTAAATGQVGVPRYDPFAMRPFCGYNMADYFGHWLKTGKELANPPRIFHVNWFRTGDDGKFLWPGFGENVRVLDWIARRIAGTADAVRTPIGLVPAPGSLNLEGLNFSPERAQALHAVDATEWLTIHAQNEEFLNQFGNRLPPQLWWQHGDLLNRLNDHLDR